MTERKRRGGNAYPLRKAFYDFAVALVGASLAGEAAFSAAGVAVSVAAATLTSVFWLAVAGSYRLDYDFS